MYREAQECDTGSCHYAGGKEVKGGSTQSTQQIDTSNMHICWTEEELSSQTAGLRQVCHHFLSANLLLLWRSPFMKWYRQPAGLGKDCFVPVKHLSGSQRTGANYRDPSKTEHGYLACG